MTLTPSQRAALRPLLVEAKDCLYHALADLESARTRDAALLAEMKAAYEQAERTGRKPSEFLTPEPESTESTGAEPEHPGHWRPVCHRLAAALANGDQPVEADALHAALRLAGEHWKLLAEREKVGSGRAAWEKNEAKAIANALAVVEAVLSEEENPPAETPEDPASTRKKRSTVKGEARLKIIGALTKHHKYADGSCLNQEPIGNNELARMAKVDKATASAFFKKEFGGRAKYRATCGDITTLVAALKLLNQEYSPHHLFGAKPPGEDERDDE